MSWHYRFSGDTFIFLVFLGRILRKVADLAKRVENASKQSEYDAMLFETNQEVAPSLVLMHITCCLTLAGQYHDGLDVLLTWVCTFGTLALAVRT